MQTDINQSMLLKIRGADPDAYKLLVDEGTKTEENRNIWNQENASAPAAQKLAQGPHNEQYSGDHIVAS